MSCGSPSLSTAKVIERHLVYKKPVAWLGIFCFVFKGAGTFPKKGAGGGAEAS